MSSSNRTDSANNNYNKDLVEAIKNDQYDNVKNILEHHCDNIDINGYIDDDTKYTILQVARSRCYTTDARIFGLLLEYGADPNHGNELVEMNGERYYYSNANSPIWGFREPYSRFRFVVQKDILSHLLRYGADPNVIHPEIGWSPLHSACLLYRYDEMELLLRHGANVNQLDRDGKLPMFHLLNKTEMWKKINLHSSRIRFLPLVRPYLLDDQADERLSCLRLLLEYGADPSVIVPKCGMTSLFQVIYHATGECQLNFIRLLMQHGADVTIPLLMTLPSYIDSKLDCDSNLDCCSCIKGDTVLHAAVRYGQVDAIRLMTESRAITSFWWLRNDDGDTVYDLAVKLEAAPIIEYFDMKWQQLRQQCYAYLLYDWIPKSCLHS